MTATAEAPAEAACSASATVSAVVWAPQWTATSSRPRQRLQVELGGPAPLLGGEEDPLPRRPQREDPVEPSRGEEVRNGPERVLVQARAAVAKRRHRRGQGTVDHTPSRGRNRVTTS